MSHQSYIATFPAGCYEIIARKLKEFTLNEIKIEARDESSVTFASSLSRERLIEIRFFTNLFMVIDPGKLRSYRNMFKSDGYRIYAIRRGSPVEMAPDLREEIGRRIEETLGLRAHTARYSNDFVLISRGDEEPRLTLRLPRAKHKREQLPPGALGPELVNIMLLLSGIRPNHTLLDPFAGSGAILTEAKRGFGVARIHAIDRKSGDATKLTQIDANSVDRIVTDPPWGKFSKQTDDQLKNLYNGFLQEASRVLKLQGIIVILSGNEQLDAILQKSQEFTLLKSYPILVSGKKASLFKLQKKLNG